MASRVLYLLKGTHAVTLVTAMSRWRCPMPILLLANTITYLKRTLSLKGMADEQMVMEALMAL